MNQKVGEFVESKKLGISVEVEANPFRSDKEAYLKEFNEKVGGDLSRAIMNRFPLESREASKDGSVIELSTSFYIFSADDIKKFLSLMRAAQRRKPKIYTGNF